MNKILKTILIISIAVFGAGFLFVPSVNAQVDELVVEYWTGTEWKQWLPGEQSFPIFQEDNFLPGQTVTRSVRATNNSNSAKLIATQAINIDDSNRLGDVLILEIKENEATYFKNDLSRFFTTGEVTLSELAENGGQTQYDFIISFYPGAGNPFQGKTLRFDILVGFQGEEGGLPPGAGTGAGGFLPPGLTIQDESVRITVGQNSVIIEWLTSYPSTSQVIYAKDGEKHILDLTDNVGTPPKYGYERTTPEYDVSPKVTSHSVIITGLTPGTKYYYRAVSHASLAISKELSFTTLGAREEEVIEEGVAGEEVPVIEISLDELFGKDQEEEAMEAGVEEAGIEEEDLLGAPELSETAVEEGPIFDFGKLLAGIGGLFRPKNLPWLILLFLAIIIILLILRRRKKKE